MAMVWREDIMDNIIEDLKGNVQFLDEYNKKYSEAEDEQEKQAFDILRKVAMNNVEVCVKVIRQNYL